MENRAMDDNQTDSFSLRSLGNGIIRYCLLTALVFVLAGRLDYWQGWLFTAIMVISFAVFLAAFSHKQELIREWLKPGPGMKSWDKIFYAVYTPAYVGIFVVGALDGGRFRWTNDFPAGLYVITGLVYLLALGFAAWAMWVNRFFSSVVRIQSDRGHMVVDSGPYRFIRHPGYVGDGIAALATGPLLGSLWALLPAGVALIALVIRTALEDNTLQKELPGYADYARRVKCRLIPGLW